MGLMSKALTPSPPAGVQNPRAIKADLVGAGITLIVGARSRLHSLAVVVSEPIHGAAGDSPDFLDSRGGSVPQPNERFFPLCACHFVLERTSRPCSAQQPLKSPVRHRGFSTLDRRSSFLRNPFQHRAPGPPSNSLLLGYRTGLPSEGHSKASGSLWCV